MVLLDTVMQPEVLEQQMQQINDIYFKVFDELYDIIREGDEMAFCYFSSWAPGKMSKLQSDISTMISQDDYRRFFVSNVRKSIIRSIILMEWERCITFPPCWRLKN